MKKTIKYELTESESNIVLQGLGELPARISSAVLQKIQSQAQPQMKKQVFIASAKAIAEAQRRVLVAQNLNKLKIYFIFDEYIELLEPKGDELVMIDRNDEKSTLNTILNNYFVSSSFVREDRFHHKIPASWEDIYNSISESSSLTHEVIELWFSRNNQK